MATKKPTTEDTATTPTESSDDVKVTVRSTPILEKAAEPEPTKADLAVHHELTITPPSQAATEPVVPEAEPTTQAEPAKVTPIETPKPVETTLINAPKPPSDDAPKTDPKPVTDGVTKTEEMQSPKVFDTKQYHLPIDEGVTRGKGKFLMIFLVFILLVVVAGAVAIDAGWIDVGFDLPFDLIK